MRGPTNQQLAADRKFVREPEREDVVDRLLAPEVVDAEYLACARAGPRGLLELAVLRVSDVRGAVKLNSSRY